MASMRARIRSFAEPLSSPATTEFPAFAATAAGTDSKLWEVGAVTGASLLAKKPSSEVAEAVKAVGAAEADDGGEGAEGSCADPEIAGGSNPSAAALVGLGAKLAKGSSVVSLFGRATSALALVGDGAKPSLSARLVHEGMPSSSLFAAVGGGWTSPESS